MIKKKLVDLDDIDPDVNFLSAASQVYYISHTAVLTTSIAAQHCRCHEYNLEERERAR